MDLRLQVRLPGGTGCVAPSLSWYKCHRLLLLECRSGLRLQSKLFSEFPICTAQVGISANYNGPRLMDCLHRFLIAVRQSPERSCTQSLLELLHIDVQRASFVVSVNDKLHGVMSIAGPRESAQVMLSIAHGRKFRCEYDKDRLG